MAASQPPRPRVRSAGGATDGSPGGPAAGDPSDAPRGGAPERILAAAAAAAGERGVAQVSLQTVAAVAGVSKALIHYHFRDRDATLDGMDLPGADLRRLRKVSFDACRAACSSSEACHALTYNKRFRACFLKGSVPRSALDRDAISWIKP